MFIALQFYFTHFELSQSLGWAKSKDPCEKKTPDHLHLPYTGHFRYVDFAYLDTTTYVEVIFHSQHFFSIFLCISTPSMSKTVNMKQRVSRGDFSCPRHISIIFATVYVEVKVCARMGAILSASAMCNMY